MNPLFPLSIDDLTDEMTPLDFEAQDEQEAELAVHAREIITGLPARPGTRR